MSRPPDHEAVDERLRQLLDVEARLQARVGEAEAAAVQRVAAARADADAAVRASHAQAAETGAAEDADERAALDRALSQLQREHEQHLRALSDVPDATIETLARRALNRALRGDGDDP